jgi:hypothetical protein
MSTYEKVAWFNLAVFAVAVAAYLGLFFLLSRDHDANLSAQVAASAFAIMALCAFGPLIFNKSRGYSPVGHDMGNGPHRRKHRYLMYWTVYLVVFIGIWLWVKFVKHGTLSDQVDVLVMFVYVTMAAFIAFLLYLYLKKQNESLLSSDEQGMADVVLYGPGMDERDLRIQRTARWSGFGVFWVVYVCGNLGVWGWARHRGFRSLSIDVSAMPLFVLGAFILIIVVHSITSIIQYRRGH